MMLPVEIENRLEDVRNQIEALGAELVDLSVKRSRGRNILTILADKAGGITLEDCAEINHRLSLFFDEITKNGSEEGTFLKSSYTLEVSSPGLDRPLKTEKDFTRVIGQEVRAVSAAESGKTRVTVGRLVSVNAAGIQLKNSTDSTLISLPLGSIVKAVREIRFH